MSESANTSSVQSSTDVGHSVDTQTPTPVQNTSSSSAPVQGTASSSSETAIQSITSPETAVQSTASTPTQTAIDDDELFRQLSALQIGTNEALSGGDDPGELDLLLQHDDLPILIFAQDASESAIPLANLPMQEPADKLPKLPVVPEEPAADLISPTQTEETTQPDLSSPAQTKETTQQPVDAAQHQPTDSIPIPDTRAELVEKLIAILASM